MVTSSRAGNRLEPLGTGRDYRRSAGGKLRVTTPARGLLPSRGTGAVPVESLRPLTTAVAGRGAGGRGYAAAQPDTRSIMTTYA